MNKKTTSPIRAFLLEEGDPAMMIMDGFDDCIAGIMYRYGQKPIVCYDRAKVIAQLGKDGMTEKEAEEYFEFNQMGAWVGDRTPCFITLAPWATQALSTRKPTPRLGLKHPKNGWYLDERLGPTLGWLLVYAGPSAKACKAEARKLSMRAPDCVTYIIHTRGRKWAEGRVVNWKLKWTMADGLPRYTRE